jgi:hypothetical protein
MKNSYNDGIENTGRDFNLENIVGNMLISQYQVDILESKLANRLYGWWVLSQDKDLNTSSYSFQNNGQIFKVSLSALESDPHD